MNFSLAVVAEVPGRLAAGDVEEKVAQDLRSRFGVRHFGMEEDAVTAALAILEPRDRSVRGASDDAKSGRRLHDAISVARPHALMRRSVRKQRRICDHIDFGAAVLALRRRFDLSVEEVRGELHAVADDQRGNAELQHLARTDRRGFGVNRLRTAGKNDRFRRELADFCDGVVERMDHGVDALLADPAGDQLCVLRAEVENQDSLCGLHYADFTRTSARAFPSAEVLATQRAVR